MNHTYVTSTDVGKRIQQTRESRRLSVEEVSERLGIPTSTVINVEAGQIDEHYQEIYAMTCIYVKSIHDLFAGFFNPSKSSLYFLRDKTDEDAETIKQYVLDCIEFQRKLYGRPIHLSGMPVAKDLRAIKKTVPVILEKRAQDVIKKHNLYKFPINIYQIAANLGIFVVFESLPSDLFNLRGFCHQEDGFSLIGINKNHPIELQRFTMAHELHHLLYDIGSVPFLCGVHNQEQIIEDNAEKFAAELLMPRESIQRLISYPPNVNYLTIHLIAEHFKVSYQASAIRLEKFGLIDSSAEACNPYYRKKDKQKTNFLLEKKIKHLKAVFGLETGIKELQVDEELETHSLCGSPIFDSSHKVCWYCGLELKQSDIKNLLIQNPYRQNISNIYRDKITSVDKKKDYTQLSLNLKIN